MTSFPKALCMVEIRRLGVTGKNKRINRRQGQTAFPTLSPWKNQYSKGFLFDIGNLRLTCFLPTCFRFRVPPKAWFSMVSSCSTVNLDSSPLKWCGIQHWIYVLPRQPNPLFWESLWKKSKLTCPQWETSHEQLQETWQLWLHLIVYENWIYNCIWNFSAIR